MVENGDIRMKENADIQVERVTLNPQETHDPIMAWWLLGDY